MKSFSLYEFSGILIPGAIVLFGISLIFPELKQVLLSDVSFGDFGLFVLLSYAAGQLIQAVGNMLENVWWRFHGGMPTDWIRTGKGKLLANNQITELERQIPQKLGIKFENGIKNLDEREWYAIGRQLNSLIHSKGSSERIEIFNSYYGLNRGIFASFFLLSILTLIFSGYEKAILLLVLAMIALYRMNRFASHYARELFIQFLAIEQKEPR